MITEILGRVKPIKCLICDVDGVLTDGKLYIDNFGNELKAFNVQDGMGLKLLISAGIEVCVITTSNNDVIDNRMRQLGIKHYFKNQVGKEEAFQQIKNSLKLNNQEIAYVGDDLPDLPIMQQVGLAVAVFNAVWQVKKVAHWQTTASGGNGAVREVCDLILTSQDKYDLALEGYFKV